MTTNDALRSKIMDELEWHALIDANQLDVSVHDRVVTVVGVVPSVAAKLVVLDTIESIGGVDDIVSELEVTPAGTPPSNDDIDRMVDLSLTWDALVPHDQITHRVEDGWVTLLGEVPTVRQRYEAERVVNHILGVRGVTNDIEVVSAEVAPSDIRSSIRSALQRRAIRAADHIDVVVDGHAVTLRGAVQSQPEKRAVVGAVSHATGVEVLCDDLVVRAVDHPPNLS